MFIELGADRHPSMPNGSTLLIVLYHARGNQSARDIKEFCSANIDAW